MAEKHVRLVREVELRDSKVDVEKRTVDFSFSSDYPVPRWFGKEILSHAPGACDLTRMNGGANALFNHNMNDYVGVVEKAWIGQDQRGHCSVKFSDSPSAVQKMNDVAAGILRNVSFGYEIDELLLTKQGQDGADSEYTATRWTPFEVSFVTVPADPTVGVGRAEGLEKLVTRANRSFEEQSIKLAVQSPAKKENVMPEVVVTPIDEKEVRTQAVKQERDRTAAITALCKRFNQEAMAQDLLTNDRTIEEARAAILEKLGMRQVPVTGNEGLIGMSEREIKQFSFLRAIKAMMDPQNRQAQDDAKFEREVSDAAQKATGRAARGMLIPFDVLRAPLTFDGKSQRDLVVGTSTAGGNLVGTNLLTASFIDILRNKSILQAAGAQTLTGLIGNIAIPRMSASTTAYWVGEGGLPTESQAAFDQVTMTPHTVGAFEDYSRRLLLQTSMDIEALIRSDLASVLALEIDRVGFYGLGSASQPLGIANTSGINTTDLAAAAPTWAEFVGMETKVNAANADIAAMKYITNATGFGALKTTVKAATYPVYLLGDDGMANGYPVLRSNQVAAGDFFFGVWNQLIIGFWSGVDILIDPYTGGVAGNVRVIAHQDVDLAVRHPEAFVRSNDTL